MIIIISFQNLKKLYSLRELKCNIAIQNLYLLLLSGFWWVHGPDDDLRLGGAQPSAAEEEAARRLGGGAEAEPTLGGRQAEGGGRGTKEYSEKCEEVGHAA